jgi:hypothetical protein
VTVTPERQPPLLRVTSAPDELVGAVDDHIVPVAADALRTRIGCRIEILAGGT